MAIGVLGDHGVQEGFLGQRPGQHRNRWARIPGQSGGHRVELAGIAADEGQREALLVQHGGDR